MSQDSNPADVGKLAAGLRILLLDVDGTLTDGGIIIMGNGVEAKRFDVQDGMGITLARAAGLTVGIITGRNSEVVQRRADELGIDELHQGVKNKLETLDKLMKQHGLDPSTVAYIGDDLPDIPIMKRVGLPIAVRNAVPEVKACCLHVTDASGGHGAVREAIDWILELRGDKSNIHQKFTY